MAGENHNTASGENEGLDNRQEMIDNLTTEQRDMALYLHNNVWMIRRVRGSVPLHLWLDGKEEEYYEMRKSKGWVDAE